MITEERARQILGVAEGADKDVIIKRYNTLLKKCRQSTTDSSAPSTDEITEAYNLLMGYLDPMKEMLDEEARRKRNPFLQKLNIDESRLSNFLHYNKYKILAGIFIFIVMFISVRSCMTRVIPDLRVVIVSEVYSNNHFGIAEVKQIIIDGIREEIPELKEISVDILNLKNIGHKDEDTEKETNQKAGSDIDNQFAAYERMRSLTVIVGGEADIFIMDRSNYASLAGSGALISLDELEDEIDYIRQDNLENLVSVDDGDEKIYGITISDSQLLTATGLKGEFIAGIATKSKYQKNAVSALKLFVKQHIEINNNGQ